MFLDVTEVKFDTFKSVKLNCSKLQNKAKINKF